MPRAEPPPTGPARSDELAARAVRLAGELLAQSLAGRSRAERRRLHRLAGLVADPDGSAFTLALTDQVLRLDDPARAARRLAALVAELGAPHFLGPVDRALLGAGARLGPRLPRVVMPLVAARVRREGGATVIPVEQQPFHRHAERRRRQGIRLNVNLLGEAILGEDEAARRVAGVVELMGRSEVSWVSLKISALSSQVDVYAFDETVAEVADRLRPVYRAAARRNPGTFVNLDMEEYRDLHLTVEVFERVLTEPEFLTLDAGIALQAYLPDSADALARVAAWARRRRAAGGGLTRVRLVKGANLAVERVEAELHGWPAAPYPSKADVDANFKRMLEAALAPPNAGALSVGVASHNLFDVAWALVLADELHAADRVGIEMLEGMAESQALATRARAGDLVLYAPVARRDDVTSSIAYLVRRLEENTAPDNYLRHVFSLTPDSATFRAERDRFLASLTHRPGTRPRRTQDRSAEAELRPATGPEAGLPVAEHAVAEDAVGGRSVGGAGRPAGEPERFVNEPDTDFSRAANRAWMAAQLRVWRHGGPGEIPAVIGGEALCGPRFEPGIDPSDPGRVSYRWTACGPDRVERAVAVARAAGPRWGGLPAAERCRLLAAAADSLARGRGEATAVMVRDGGKTVAEADPEVSEAVDFARYYGLAARRLDGLDGVAAGPVGTVVVVPPWNFPFSIPAGGVLAALAAGNAVILKPAPETVLTAWVLCRRLWAAGIPGDVLQFVPCTDDEAGRHLVTHPDIDAVVLTGSFDTAALFRQWRPDLHLAAETSGKNAIVVTAAADLDAAVRDLVRSAFGHAGQKCSAASLAIVEAAVLERTPFLRQLADATSSLRVGPAWDPPTRVGPLIRPPEGPLARALTTLEAGEEWLVEPRVDPSNPHLWSPGVKVGVRAGSWLHRTECFGPVLAVLAAADLDQAIDWQNAVEFGLTGGLHSLDHGEVEHWLDRVEVGNAYVNRPITGAVVGRQPFGGWKRSAVGPGAKAGGPNYLFSLCRFRGPVTPGPGGAPTGVPAGIGTPGDGGAGEAGLEDWAAREFRRGHDPSGLGAEANVLRYRPVPGPVLVRVADGSSDGEARFVLAAARVAGVATQVSSGRPRPGVASEVTVESEADLAARLPAGCSRLRALGDVSEALRRAALAVDLPVDDTPGVPSGRIELLRWYREQAVSIPLHRYGDPISPAAAGVPPVG